MSLKKVFQDLRKAGITARQNFACCSSCASSELFEMAEKRKNRAVVYYHHQDAVRMKEDNELNIRYGVLDEDEEDAKTRDLALEILSVFKKNGMTANWDGDTNTVITVINPLGEKEESK